MDIEPGGYELYQDDDSEPEHECGLYFTSECICAHNLFDHDSEGGLCEPRDGTSCDCQAGWDGC